MKEFKPAPKFTPTFLKETRRLKSGKRKELEKVVLKILDNPARGKPLRYSFKSVRRSREISGYLRDCGGTA